MAVWGKGSFLGIEVGEELIAKLRMELEGISSFPAVQFMQMVFVITIFVGTNIYHLKSTRNSRENTQHSILPFPSPNNHLMT